MRPCFKFTATADAAVATLSVYDEIGFWGVQASDFRAALNAVEGPKLRVEISSPGGDYFAGLAMYNMLVQSGKEITTVVMGIAASAATVVALAGSTRSMPSNAFLMVHNISNDSGGTAVEHRELADQMDRISNTLVGVYMKATGLDEPAVRAMLAKDTWMTADEALANGFATEVTDAVEATASFDMARADLPAHIKAIYSKAVQTPEEIAAAAVIETARLAAEEAAAVEAAAAAALVTSAAETPVVTQIVELAVKAGLTGQSAFLALACDTVAAAQIRIATAREIVALCNAYKLTDRADVAIRANQSLTEFRAVLVAELAASDVHTSTVKKITEQTSNSASPGVSGATVWASRNKQTNPKKD